MGYRKAPNPEGKTTVSHYSTLPRHSEASVSRIIDDVQPTSETLTGRAGLSLFVRYVRGIGLYPHLDRLFGSLRKSRKGQPVTEIFKQLLCFLLDGSSRHLVSFDALKEDAGYGGAIETKPEALLSSHAVKRFFGRFSMWRIWLFRRVLQQLFLWRLRLQQPPLILLGMDTMVMDNDEAPQRHGVAPTYKRVKGFQPLQVTWGRLLIDAVFRGGDKHSNHADTAQKTLSHLIQKIRRKYRSDVPIIVRLDSGFFDQKLLQVLETLEVGYIVAGKLYGDVQQYILQLEETAWGVSRNGDQEWHYVELGDRRGSWDKFRRALFCRPAYENRQRLLAFARPDQILYTNLGCGCAVDEQLRQAGLQRWLQAEAILQGYQGRGADELVHRALKDFASQTLPFKRFAPNAAYYYTLLVAFFLYECFKEDVCQPVVPLGNSAELLSHDLTPADRRCSGEDRPPCRADPLESNGGHLEAASDRPTLAKERPPAAFRLGLNLKKPKPRCCLMAPVCPLAPRLRVFSSFRERNYPRAPF